MGTDSQPIVQFATHQSTGRNGASITTSKQISCWTVRIAMRVAIRAIASPLKFSSGSVADVATVIAPTISITVSSVSTAEGAIRPIHLKRCSESNEDANSTLAKYVAALVTGSGTGTVRSFQHWF